MPMDEMKRKLKAKLAALEMAGASESERMLPMEDEMHDDEHEYEYQVLEPREISGELLRKLIERLK